MVNDWLKRMATGACCVALVACGGSNTTPGDSGVDVDAQPDGIQLGDNCNSLFAAQILELQRTADPSFPVDCDAPLRSGQGTLGDATNSCPAGESPNACRDRVYLTPPALSAFPEGNCTRGSEGCLNAKWLPMCADGTDTGCTQPEAVCQDGTRPQAQMEPGNSNAWVIYLGGEGKPCYGDRCWFFYRYGDATGDVTLPRAMSTMHPRFQFWSSTTATGILNGNSTGPVVNPFLNYNRVRFNRCSDASSDGMETVPLFWLDTTQTEPTPVITGSAPVWYRGFAIWQSLFHSLTTTAGRDLDGDGNADLPSLANATTVILAASSDATLWLTHAADALRDELRTIAGTAVDVRLVVDGHWSPVLDNEARYHANAPAGFNMFDYPYSTTGLCQLPDDQLAETSEDCSDYGLRLPTLPDGSVSRRGWIEPRGHLADASCEAFHGAAAAPCFDANHVLIHHVSTPWMVIADQEDSAVSKLAPNYAHDPGYTFPTAETWRTRLLDQARDIRNLWATASREDGAGTPGDAVMVLRKSRREGQLWDQARHTHLDTDAGTKLTMTRCDQNDEAVETANLAQLIHTWVNGSLPLSRHYIVEDKTERTGTSDYYVSGSYAAGTTCRTPD